jgi:hypothetical protein
MIDKSDGSLAIDSRRIYPRMPETELGLLREFAENGRAR